MLLCCLVLPYTKLKGPLAPLLPLSLLSTRSVPASAAGTVSLTPPPSTQHKQHTASHHRWHIYLTSVWWRRPCMLQQGHQTPQVQSSV